MHLLTGCQSGRNFKDLLYKGTAAAEVFADRLLSNAPGKAFADKNYEKLELLKQAKLERGAQAQARIQHLKEESHDKREGRLQLRHREYWLIEQERLQDLSLDAWAALDVCVRECSTDDFIEWRAVALEHVTREMHYQELLNTIVANVELLQSRARALQAPRGPGYHRPPQDSPDAVLRELQSTRRQFGETVLRLAERARLLGRELDALYDSSTFAEVGLSRRADDEDDERARRAGEVAWKTPSGAAAEMVAAVLDVLVDCRDAAVRESVVQQLEDLNAGFHTRLAELERIFGDTLTGFGGWPREDHLHFTAVREQYMRPGLPAFPPIRGQTPRSLFMARLLSELPHRTREEVVAHEQWVDAREFYHKQRRLVQQQWASSLTSWGDDAQALMAESIRMQQAQAQRQEDRVRLDERRLALHEKVYAWRQTQQEQRAQEEAEAVEREREYAAELARQRDQEQSERTKIKHQLHEYRSHQQQIADEQAAQMAAAEAALEPHRRQQAHRNRERIAVRHAQHQARLDLRAGVAEQAELERQERERRLDLLRQQVRVDAPSDPARLWQATAASAAAASVREEERAVAKTMVGQMKRFTNLGYDDHQILADQRLRIEQALRNIGLVGTDYARRVLQAVPPPREPRPDNISTVFKQ